jgi:hypothetical protein
VVLEMLEISSTDRVKNEEVLRVVNEERKIPQTLNNEGG